MYAMREERRRAAGMMRGLAIRRACARPAPPPFAPIRPGAFLTGKTGRTTNALLLLAIAVMVALLAVTCCGSAGAEAGDAYTVQLESGVLNIRAKPWVGAEIIGKLYAGDAVTLISEADGWALIEAPIEAGQGYVKTDYLTLTPDECGLYRNASGGRARVRREPNGKLVRWLKEGATVTVTRWTTVDGERWAYIGDGYVLGSCLEATGDD